MKYVRILLDNQPAYGVLADDEVRLLTTDFFRETLSYSKVSVAASEANFLAPTASSKVICVGLNYRDHAEEVGLTIPESPVLFLKPSTAIIGSGEKIITPPACTQLDYEAELAVVIKHRAYRVGVHEAADYILGYSCANDVTARNLQSPTGQWTIAKGFDTFCPYGPVVKADIDPRDLEIQARLNGSIKQHSRTSELLFDVPTLVSYISSVMTLLPGDIILTGTPGGIGPMESGDTVEVIIEGIGTLSNPVS